MTVSSAPAFGRHQCRIEDFVEIVEQPAAIRGDGLHHVVDGVEQLARVIEPPAELAGLAGEPARRLGEDVLPKHIDSQSRCHLVAAQHGEEEVLELVVCAWDLQSLQELERALLVPK